MAWGYQVSRRDVNGRGREESGRGGDRDRRARLLLLELEAVERGVAAAFAQQLVVAAGFDDAAVLDDVDAVGMRDGVQAVRDHQRGAALAEMLHRLAHLQLGFGIERR